MATNLSQFHQLFFDEARDHLAAMEQLLLALDPNAPDAEELNAIFRAAHSIKGGAATFGFADIAAFTHNLENILDGIRKRERVLRADMVDVFLACGDTLLGMVEQHQKGSGSDPARIAELSARLAELEKGELPPTGVAPLPRQDPVSVAAAGASHNAAAPATAGDREADGDADFGLFEADLAAEDENFGLFDSEAASGPEHFGFFDADPAAEDDSFGLFHDAPAEPASVLAEAIDPAAEDESFGLFDSPAVPADLEAPCLAPLVQASASASVVAAPDLVRRPSGESVAAQSAASAAAPADGAGAPRPAAAGQARRKPAAEGDNSLRVGIEKVDLLINLVGELVITQSMLAQGMAGLDPAVHEPLLNSMGQLLRNTRDLQEATMSMRMIPMNAVFSRFQRLVRDLSGQLSKKVELKISGEQTELDKTLVEKLADPLTHLVRNSIDHGIELPEARRAAGKAEAGTVKLNAFHQGGAIVIEVQDDGAGLNRARILAKAHERGIAIDPNAPDATVWDLIFAPGFSTAAEVTAVSGRGVGMDVVKRNIQGLGGRIEIHSDAGKGTRTTIRLPLTLAILDGMSVTVGDEVFVVPLAAISESLQPQSSALRTIGGSEEVVEVRGSYLPVIKLHKVLNIPAHSTRAEDGILVLLDDGKRRVALCVDALIGQQQFVIKSLETNFRRTEGFSGATILGDGRVAFILDTDALVHQATRH
jgi:two-component system chemotaxis sensor kinase CheA